VFTPCNFLPNRSVQCGCVLADWHALRFAWCMRFFNLRSGICFLVSALAASACAASADTDAPDVDEETQSDDDSDDDAISQDLRSTSAGPCANEDIQDAVECAVRKGARVLSYYRSPKDQERVRRENRCSNRCTGMAGCVRPTADCSRSPHTQCMAVDLVNDGAPASKSELRRCGLGKTSKPHRNHFDLL
jgi:hypothetical protein